MKRIALALILFQLIGCAKQPVVITHPEKKQEEETPQHDTPQVPKTNYLKRGAYIGGTVLAILASVGLIAYCCTRKEEKDKPLTEFQRQQQQDNREIDTILNRNVALLGRSDKKYETVREILEEKYSKFIWTPMRQFLLTTGLFQDEETGQQVYQSQLATCRKSAQRGIDPLLKNAHTELNQNDNLDVLQWILGKENAPTVL